MSRKGNVNCIWHIDRLLLGVYELLTPGTLHFLLITGAFLIPYGIFAVFLGFPMMFLEVSLGQYTRQGTVNAWKISPIMKVRYHQSYILHIVYIITNLSGQTWTQFQKYTTKRAYMRLLNGMIIHHIPLETSTSE